MSTLTRESATDHARRLVLAAISERLEDGDSPITVDPDDSEADNDLTLDTAWHMFEVLKSTDDWATADIYTPTPVTDDYTHSPVTDQVNRRALRHIVEAADLAEEHFSPADTAGELDVDDEELDDAVAAVKTEVTNRVCELRHRLFGDPAARPVQP